MGRKWAAGLISGLFVAVTAGALAAQTVTVRALAAPSGPPLHGAMVTLGNSQGHYLSSLLTDARGIAEFEGLAAGRYTVRVEMIGYGTELWEGAVGDGGEPVSVELVLPVRAIAIEGLRVDGDERCRLDPNDGRRLNQLWDEVRKALEAARWTDRRGLYWFRTERIVRDRELRSRRLLGEERSRGVGYDRAPYHSLSAEALHRKGYVQPSDEGDVYYAPDAEVLLSDTFLEAHCMGLAIGEGATEGWVGITFRPRDRPRVPDIEGTLWIDPGSWQLEKLDFRYVGLDRPVPVRDIGGEVRFRRLPDGTWVVPEWAIRTPLMGRGTDLQGRSRVYQIGIREEAGSVTELRRPGGEVILTSARGSLEGVVLDSLGLDPVAGAMVALEGVGRSVATDEAGGFAFPELEPGRYLVEVSHPRLEAFAHVVAPVEAQVSAGRMVAVRMQLPSIRTILTARCPGDHMAEDEDLGVLVGRVVEAASGLGLTGAQVGWRHGAEETTVPVGEGGWYHLCDVPRGVPLVLRATWGPLTGMTDTVTVPADLGIADHDVSVDLPGLASVQGRVFEADTGVPVEGVELRIEAAEGPADAWTAITDDLGGFALEGIPPGRHVIRVRHSSYREGSATLSLGATESVQVEVRLPAITPEVRTLLRRLAPQLPPPVIDVVHRERGGAPR